MAVAKKSSARLFLLTAAFVACGGDPVATPAEAPDAQAAPAPTRTSPTPPPVAEPDAGAPDSGILPAPPCTKSPCAARPIVFVHGFRGSNDDWFTMLNGLVAKDSRYDSFVLTGTTDHASFPTRSIGRRSWLFSFDYYNAAKEDERGAHTAGPGRIGSNTAYTCTAPMGSGHIVADNAAYDQGITHDYAKDLASMIDDVLRMTGAPSVDIVAHSMGGLIVRSYLAFHSGGPKVTRALLLASPVEGLGLAAFASFIGIGQPSLMNAHELTELDSGSFLTKTEFVRCGDGSSAKGSFGSRLLAEETKTPLTPELYVMSAERDLYFGFAATDHPQAKSHDVVPSVDHPGILKSEPALSKVRAVLGGNYP